MGSRGVPDRRAQGREHGCAVSEPIDRDRRGRPIKRQCSGHRKDGGRCRRPANRGATVCNSHGAAAPQVKAAALRRVAEAKAAAVLARWTPPGDGAVVDLTAQLAKVAARAGSMYDFLTDHLAALAPEAWAVPGELTVAKFAMWRQAQDDLRGLVTDLARLGVDHDDDRRAAEVGDWAADVIGAMLARPGLPVPRGSDLGDELAAIMRATPLRHRYRP